MFLPRRLHLLAVLLPLWLTFPAGTAAAGETEQTLAAISKVGGTVTRGADGRLTGIDFTTNRAGRREAGPGRAPLAAAGTVAALA